MVVEDFTVCSVLTQCAEFLTNHGSRIFIPILTRPIGDVLASRRTENPRLTEITLHH